MARLRQDNPGRLRGASTEQRKGTERSSRGPIRPRMWCASVAQRPYHSASQLRIVSISAVCDVMMLAARSLTS